MKKILNALFVLLMMAFLSFAIGDFLNLNFFVVILFMAGLSFLTPNLNGALYVGLNKEIWLAEIKEKFYPDTSFLKEPRDLSEFVEYDKINLAEAGVDPNVLINNTTYPIPVAQRNDVPISLDLDTYDTENTIIRNIERAELSYDKRQSVIYGHKQALRTKFAEKAAHAYAPSSDSTFTPVLPTVNTGKISFEDILNLYKRFNQVDIPVEGRVLVLNPEHEAQLLLEDKNLYKQVMDTRNLYGFKVYTFSKTPIFDKSNGTKKAFGAAPGANDTVSSIAFHKDEVMRAMGTFDMFVKEKDPLERADIIGFQMRALALPIRNKAIGAIYTS